MKLSSVRALPWLLPPRATADKLGRITLMVPPTVIRGSTAAGGVRIFQLKRRNVTSGSMEKHFDRQPKVSDYLLTMSSVKKTLPRHLPAAERRAVTVAAVIALAAQQNPQEITTTAIADRMSLTQAALFRHFPTKEALWQAVMEWVTETLLARIDEAAQAAASPLAALEAVFMAHIDFVARHPGVPRILLGELQRAEATPAKRAVQTLLKQYGLRLHALVEQGIAQGELDREVDPAAAAALFIGSIQGLVMQALLAGKVQLIRAAAPGAFAIFARGVRRVP